MGLVDGNITNVLRELWWQHGHGDEAFIRLAQRYTLALNDRAPEPEPPAEKPSDTEAKKGSLT